MLRRQSGERVLEKGRIAVAHPPPASADPIKFGYKEPGIHSTRGGDKAQ